MSELNFGVSIADTSYPVVVSKPGEVRIEFTSSQGVPRAIQFMGVPAFRWQEAEVQLEAAEPWDGEYELFGTEWLAKHTNGATVYSGKGLRHLRLNFNAWGHFEVLCTSFAVCA